MTRNETTEKSQATKVDLALPDSLLKEQIINYIDTFLDMHLETFALSSGQNETGNMQGIHSFGVLTMIKVALLREASHIWIVSEAGHDCAYMLEAFGDVMHVPNFEEDQKNEPVIKWLCERIDKGD